MHLSIMGALYMPAPYMEEFYAYANIQTEEITNDYEIVFVNDGSLDNSLNTCHTTALCN